MTRWHKYVPSKNSVQELWEHGIYCVQRIQIALWGFFKGGSIMQHICYLAKQPISAAHVGKLGFDFWQMHNTAITKWWVLITGFQPGNSAGVKELHQKYISQRYNLSITFQLFRALLLFWLPYHAIISNVPSLSSSNPTGNIELSTAGSGKWLLEEQRRQQVWAYFMLTQRELSPIVILVLNHELQVRRVQNIL